MHIEHTCIRTCVYLFKQYYNLKIILRKHILPSHHCWVWIGCGLIYIIYLKSAWAAVVSQANSESCINPLETAVLTVRVSYSVIETNLYKVWRQTYLKSYHRTNILCQFSKFKMLILKY